MARKSWEQLSADTRRRLTRKGITPEMHASGVDLTQAYGKSNRKFNEAVNKYAATQAKFYGRDYAETRTLLRGLPKGDAWQIIQKQQIAESLYLEGEGEQAHEVWEIRDRTYSDYLYYYHHIFG